MKNIPGWLVPLAVAVVVAAVAWGGQQSTLGDHDEQIKAQWVVQAKVEEALKEQAEINGRIDERTQQIQLQLQQLLQELRRANGDHR